MPKSCDWLIKIRSTLANDRYGLNKGSVLNFSLSQILRCLLSVIALCEEKKYWRQE